MLKAWMQKDSDKPLGAEKHLVAGTVAGESVDCIQCMYIQSTPDNSNPR